ncbi:MAG: MBL fold metallo-hydrolase [Chitinophagaceae bacterium]
MKITKYLHSCLLVENQGIQILIDPGNYTYQENAFPTKTIGKIDYIAITHEHQDHMDPTFLKELALAHPEAKIMANDVIKTILLKDNLIVDTTTNQFIKAVTLRHEKMLNFPLPVNWGLTIFDELFHPGDSLQFNTSPRILALPVQAPWGSMVQAAERALIAKPKIIIPIHDYHWNVSARQAFYQMLTSYFTQYNIQFLQPETGKTLEV